MMFGGGCMMFGGGLQQIYTTDVSLAAIYCVRYV